MTPSDYREALAKIERLQRENAEWREKWAGTFKSLKEAEAKLSAAAIDAAKGRS